jgi:hypothetical protein
MPDDIPAIDDQPLALRVTDEQIAAARRAVLLRHDRGELDAAETRDVLGMLGLVPYDGAGRTSQKPPRDRRNRVAS